MVRGGSNIYKCLIIIISGLIPGISCQFFARKPVSRDIKIESFRYGKEPYRIRCNRGDTLNLTFSTKDTGHSFFLEEFNLDVKVSPAQDEVTVFQTVDPTAKPRIVKEIKLIAQHKGILNYLISKSNYRCHVWCGPMHAFEQGKMVIRPNTLLFFSIGALFGILILWLMGLSGKNKLFDISEAAFFKRERRVSDKSFIKKALVARWPQLIITIVTLAIIYLVIIISVFGTKMSGRNLGVLLMWAVWLFFIVAVITPLTGRGWCTICPLPFIGDYLQRGSWIFPSPGKRGRYNNRYTGLFLKWPEKLRNEWCRLIIFLLLATFSTTLVAVPRVSGIVLLMLVLMPCLFALIWELRAFCRYICPVSVFVSPFSRMSRIALRPKSQEVCDHCKPHYCENGNLNGWACPYGLNVGKIKENTDCGLCLECLRSCSYDNVAIKIRPFASETGTRSLSEAWLTIAIFTISIVYSILYLGPWPYVRDFVNIIDKKNWDLFGIYMVVLWCLTLVVIPGLLYLLAYSGNRFSGAKGGTGKIFLEYAGVLIPLGLMLWIAFVIPMLFVNITFVIQSFSDPLGWGWDFFGTANIPWHQFLPQYVPWFQSGLVLYGYYLSMRNIGRVFSRPEYNKNEKIWLSLPAGLFLTAAAVFMIFFFTN